MQESPFGITLVTKNVFCMFSCLLTLTHGTLAAQNKYLIDMTVVWISKLGITKTNMDFTRYHVEQTSRRAWILRCLKDQKVFLQVCNVSYEYTNPSVPLPSFLPSLYFYQTKRVRYLYLCVSHHLHWLPGLACLQKGA